MPQRRRFAHCGQIRRMHTAQSATAGSTTRPGIFPRVRRDSLPSQMESTARARQSTSLLKTTAFTRHTVARGSWLLLARRPQPPCRSPNNLSTGVPWPRARQQLQRLTLQPPIKPSPDSAAANEAPSQNAVDHAANPSSNRTSSVTPATAARSSRRLSQAQPRREDDT